MNSKTVEIESTFHELVQPKDKISDLCTKMTRITQSMVEDKPFLEETLEKLHKWMSQENLLDGSKTFIFVTYGDLDFKTMLFDQCKSPHEEFFKHFEKWVNIKKTFTKSYKLNRRTDPELREMLDISKENPVERKPTKGIEVCHNLFIIMRVLIDYGEEIKCTQREIVHVDQVFDYFLVLDFEATCEKDVKLEVQEIIEFPVLKVNGKTLEVEATFHEYIAPKKIPILTPFCTELTGITQDMVDGKLHFEEVLKKFEDWLIEHDLVEGKKTFTFITCGDWDLLKMLPQQCDFSRVKIPSCFKSWVNIKKIFSKCMNQERAPGMMGMLSALKIKHIGRHHSGIAKSDSLSNCKDAVKSKAWLYSPPASDIQKNSTYTSIPDGHPGCSCKRGLRVIPAP